MSKKRKNDKRPRSICHICNKPGYVGEDVIVTGSGIWIHHGDCHRTLIDNAKQTSQNQEMGGCNLKPLKSTPDTSYNPPLFLLFDK